MAEVDPDTVTFNVMSIESVLYDLSDSSPLVHLIEEETPYRYPLIPIALAEAVALHNVLDKHRRTSTGYARGDGRGVATTERRHRRGADHPATTAGSCYAELDLMTPRGHEAFALSYQRRVDTRDAPGRSRTGAVRRIGAAGLLRLGGDHLLICLP